MLLEGVRVVEMASVITGPLAGLLLADLGADVVKVEPPGGGDPFRSWETMGGAMRSSFAAFNRGKRSIILDIKSAAGREAYLRLAGTADVVIENFRPGRMDRQGLGFAALSALNPRLVYCSITGMGSAGPHAGRPTFDAVAQAVSGLWSQLTDLSDPEPVGPPIADQLTALYAAIGVLAALSDRDRTGRGKWVEVDMLSACLGFQSMGIASTTWNGTVPTKSSRAQISQSYAFVASDGLPFAIHLSTPDKFWRALCAVVGRPDLIEDPRSKTKAARIAHYDELRAILGEVFRTGPRDHWLAALADHDVPAAPILTVREALDHPQVRAGGMVEDTDPSLGYRRGLARSPVSVGGRHLAAGREPPQPGEHTDEILAELGLPVPSA